MPYSGACNCGGVQIHIKEAPQNGCMCHCVICRKGSGSLGGYVFMVASDEVQVEGDPRTWGYVGGSGMKVVRYFCDECGSQLYAECDVMPNQMFICAGLFPPHTLVAPTMEMYTKNCESWETPFSSAQRFETQPSE